MSFGNEMRKARNPARPFRARVGALRACVQRYRPYGFHATLAALRELAGPFDRDEAALLRALDLIEESRAHWLTDVAGYADDRAVRKRGGERSPRPDEDDPGHQPDYWYGPARLAVVEPTLVFLFRSRLGTFNTVPLDSVGLAVRALAADALAGGGRLPATERATLADLTTRLRRTAGDRGPGETQALLRVTRLLAAAIP
jgi:hypothetical protein